MESFKKFIESKLLFEADPPAAGGPSPMVASTEPSMGGPPGMPPSGGITSPASLGGVGGPPGGVPSMGMGGPLGTTSSGPQSGSLKLKAYNVWDVLEKILK